MLKNLVLLPALMADTRLYTAQVEELSSLSLNIQSFVNKNYDNIQDFAKYVITNTPAEIALIGTSMGGYVAMEIMRQNPKKVKKLCLIGTNYRADYENKRIERLNIIKELQNTNDANFIGINDKVIASYIFEVTPKKDALIRAMIKDLGRKVFITQQQMILSRPNYEEDFKNYPHTLFIVGEHDPITPPDLMEEMCRLANGKMVILKDCGHLAPIDKPERVSALIKEWLVS
ncbi:alpha/beta fold hydrolase [Candidatus Hepatincola sp. Pdp]